MLALYRDEKTSPFAGMLPVLAQAPVVGILYTLFIRPEIAGHPNDLLTHDLFGAPLGTSLVSAVFGGTATPATFLVFGALLLVIIATAEVTRRVFRPAPVDDDSSLGAAMNSPAMQRVLGSLHYLTAVFAVFVPLAAALYLTVTVVWTLVQRMLLRRRYPLATTGTAGAAAPISRAGVSAR